MTPSYINYRFTDIGDDNHYEYVSIWFDGAETCFAKDYYISITGEYDLETGAQFDRFGCEI
jgi:hypothetical protein